MASAPIPLLIDCSDPQRDSRLVSFDSAGKYTSGQTAIRHTSPQIALRCVTTSLSNSRLWDDMNLEAARAVGGVRWSLGEFDKAPTSGDWPLALDGDDTGLDELPYDVTAAALKTALDANPAVVTAGGISSVVKNGRSYRITFTTVGAKADFTSADNTLLPLSSVTIRRARVGDADTKEIVVITVKRRPYALCDSWTAAPAPSVSVETAIVGDASPATNCVQVITLTPGTYGGTYSVELVLPNVVTAAGAGTTTANIVLAGSDNAAQVLAKLQQHPEAVNDDGTSNIAVTGNAGDAFTVEFIAELGQLPIAEMVATNINLLAPRTLTGTLSLDQDMIFAAFDAAGENATSITLVSELEIEFPDEPPDVPYQDTWTIKKNVLDLAGSLPAPSTSYPLPGFIVQYRRDITSFALLGAVPTAGGAVQCLLVNIAGEPRLWGLVSGTDATDTPNGIKRPDDFHATTNPYVWKAIL